MCWIFYASFILNWNETGTLIYLVVYFHFCFFECPKILGQEGPHYLRQTGMENSRKYLDGLWRFLSS